MVEETALPNHQEATKHAAGAAPEPRTNAQNGPTAEGEDSYPASRHSSWGGFYEILCVASLTGCFLILALDLNVGVTLKLLSLLALAACALIAFAAAVNRTAAAGRAEKTQDGSVKYKVTWARLRTLEQVDVPPDVRGALAKLVGLEMTKSEFIKELAFGTKTDLGLARTNEFADKILKYTRLDTAPDAKPDGGGGWRGADARAGAVEAKLP
ncbi:MAG TPA: hypothetical protein VF736_20880 [Pyrinomonadaceae bacterium]|jgi:drug/metabolite transporter superfamily protein YnfA